MNKIKIILVCVVTFFLVLTVSTVLKLKHRQEIQKKTFFTQRVMRNLLKERQNIVRAQKSLEKERENAKQSNGDQEYDFLLSQSRACEPSEHFLTGSPFQNAKARLRGRSRRIAVTLSQTGATFACATAHMPCGAAQSELDPGFRTIG